MTAAARQTSIRTVAFASLIGTTIEWYDFFLYGTATALVFNKLFFPTFDPLMGTLLSLGTYSVAFVARPIGGIVIGHYGDKIGRKSMLVLTLVIMGVATFLIGVLPTYSTAWPDGAGPAGRAADRAGIRRRRRVGRRGADGGRARAAGQARLLRQLAADRRAGRPAAVDHRLFPVFADAGGGLPVLGLARPVSAEHPARGRRPDHQGAHPRDARVRAPEGDASGSAHADRRGASHATRRKCCSRWARGSPRTARSTSTPRSSSSTPCSTCTWTGTSCSGRSSSWRPSSCPRSRSTARCRIASADGRSICSAPCARP